MNKIKIGILKEENDKRAIFLPQHLQDLVNHYEFIAESGLGEEIGYSNDDYTKIGVKIETKENIWKMSNIIFKYKKPKVEDIKKYGNNKILCSLLHPEGDINLINEMLKNNIRSFSFEYFKSGDIYPLAHVGGQIAGKMGVFYANHFLQSQFGGNGKSLFSIDGAEKAHILIIGHGHVGSAAISTALKLGCKVTVLGKDYFKFRKQTIYLQEKVDFITENELNKVLPKVDAIIGAILISVDSTPPILDKENMKLLKKQSVIIDITCGYGTGYLPELFEKTSLDSPIKITKTGQLYCKIDNLPSAYPLTSSQAYGKQISMIIPEIIDYIFFNKESTLVSSGEITNSGYIVHNGVLSDLLSIHKGNLK